MKNLTLFAATAVFGICLLGTPTASQAQVSFGIQIGAEPMCPYGYYDYAPYRCAPFGYYGPRWFENGVFIGAGPWFHGPEGFRGEIDRHYDPRYGYRGPYPHRGEHAEWARHHDWERHYRGHEFREEHMHDGDHHDDHDHHDGH